MFLKNSIHKHFKSNFFWVIQIVFSQLKFNLMGKISQRFAFEFYCVVAEGQLNARITLSNLCA